MENYYVYLHLNKINGKKYYGITSEAKPEIRWKKGYSHNKHFSSAIKKYGWDSFEHIIIANKLTKIEAETMEQQLIARDQTNNPQYGYNLTSGGGAGVFRHSEESKRLMSKHTKGKLNPMYGKQHSEETKAKISKALSNHPKTSKRVLCIETNQVFPSSREVERQLGIQHYSINQVCNGKQKTAGKMHWKYITEEEYNLLKEI